ncbi:MAG: DUF3307 domain-containing protein [Actinomycetota bacterium]|nr:DUF3307 domain-containing protein [Actinomycetota bacterium]
MPWVEAFALFAVSHLVGDYLLQTDWQATHKRGGLRADAVARRALLSHVATYTVAFVPALLLVADHAVPDMLWMAVLVAVPHAVQDDGRLVAWWMRRIKGAEVRTQPVAALAVDQTLHVVALLALALVAGH